ncbi:acyl-CoA thioesterase [Epibacterium ulvae]|uniref:acyl-CoA thioesterase n=1 Tax=Epibacterium ulvae TaxID=1156985 RepID=UPI001BFC7A95|nr:acyl-CoA thioesterase [Epibacterium ulvae]MBT8152415.1 acyl-CoA thioesterase [Epibacterium ulvae]
MDIRFHTPLTPDEQRQLGLAEPQPISTADRVRYSEIDILQHVNNKAYLDWFEMSRVVHFNTLCLSHFEGHPEPRTVLRNANIHYVQEMHLGDIYVATSRIVSFRRTSYVLDQQIWSGGTLRCRMEGVMVLRHPEKDEGYPLPDSLISFLTTEEGARRDA